MGGHSVRAVNVPSDELLPRTGSMEHRIRIAGSLGLFHVDCESP